MNGKKGELTAAEFATQYETLLEKGAEFDFSNFDNVDLSTEKGPLAGTALKRQGKYGSKDIYIVTARPNASQQAIKLWADSIGLNIPLENIITLEDGSPQAKADWLLSKAEQGYNDFYFADDSQLNVDLVKNILGQIDVKSRVQLAIADKANRLDQEMNDLIEDATDIGSGDIVSDVEARIEGKKRDKGFFKRILRQFKITASADDFLGLGYYLFGKGEKGTRQQKWFIENLIEPYNKAKQQLIPGKNRVDDQDAQELWNRTVAQEDVIDNDIVYEIPTAKARLKLEESDLCINLECGDATALNAAAQIRNLSNRMCLLKNRNRLFLSANNNPSIAITQLINQIREYYINKIISE